MTSKIAPHLLEELSCVLNETDSASAPKPARSLEHELNGAPNPALYLVNRSLAEKFQDKVLRALSKNAWIRPHALAERVHSDSRRVLNFLRKLERKGLVERRTVSGTAAEWRKK